MNWQDLNINTHGKQHGQIKTLCPKCNSTRTNKRDMGLSCNLDSGAYHCHYCEWQGNIFSIPKKAYKKPVFNNKTNLSEPLVKWFEGRGINQSTLLKIKITEGLEYMPQKQKEVNTIQFNYFLNGELINTKFRSADKCFKLVSEAELIPYNMDSIYMQKDCIITEGEIDALSFIQCGFNSVISVPNGATTNLEYLDRFIETHFEDKETIYIAADTDKKGMELRAELIRRFGAEKCKIVSYGECKDANELLMKIGCGVAAVQEAIKGAKDVKLDGIFEVMDVEDELNNLYEIGLQKGATIGHTDFDDLISFELGRLLIVTGIPSHGKSEFVDEMLYRLNLIYKWKIAYFSPENHPLQLHISKIVSKLTGKKFDRERLSRSEYYEARDMMQDNYFFIDPKDSSDLDTILEKASWLVKKKGIKTLVIDPYNKLEHNMQNGQSETQYISTFLDRLIMFAKQKGIMIVLVAHPIKMKKEGGEFEVPNLYSINGSSHFYNKTDYGLCVYKNKISNMVDIHIQKVKFKHLGHEGVTQFHYNMNNGRYAPNINGQPEWDNDNHLTKQLFNDSIKEIQPNLEFEDLPDFDN